MQKRKKQENKETPGPLGAGALVIGILLVLVCIVQITITDGQYLLEYSTGHRGMPLGGLFILLIGIALIAGTFPLKKNSEKKKNDY